MPFPKVVANTYAQTKSKFAIFKQVTNGLHKKPSFLIIALFILFGTGGVVAATSISINSGSAISLGAGYTTATACDENVSLKAKTALDASTGQLYVASIELSDISQNPTTGCGNKTMEMALKINGQITYASWDIPSSFTDSTFNFSAATMSISDYNAMTALTPFAADGLTNIALAKIGSFQTTSWTSFNSGIDWNYITSSADGTKLAATDYAGYIYTSTDSGVNWYTMDDSSGVKNWREIASSSDGTKLAAVADYVYTSTDSGASWTQRTTSGARNWILIASSADGTKLAAAVNNGNIYTSVNSGASWTARTASGSRVWNAITSSADGTKLAATVVSGRIYTSADSGVTWTARDTNREWNCLASSADGTKLVAAESFGGGIYTSSNSGVSWTLQSGYEPSSWYAVTSSSDGTKLAIIGTSDADNLEYIYTSSDSGVTWKNRYPNEGVDMQWQDIASSADGTKLAVAEKFGDFYSGSIIKTRSNN